MKTDVLLVLCTFPNPEKARQIGAALIERQVAACINLIPGIHSIYRWQDQVESADEVLGLIKTTRATYPALESTLQELHPYEVPEILSLPIEAGSESYLKWLTASLTHKS